MRTLWFWGSTLTLGVVLTACGAGPGPDVTQDATLATQSVTMGAATDRQLSFVGSHTPQAVTPGADLQGGAENPALWSPLGSGGIGAASVGPRNGPGTIRRFSTNRLGSPVNLDSALSTQGVTFFPKVRTSFDGLNAYDQRTANGGNQFTLDVPDQALCGGNGYVLESVNTVLRVYDRAGTPRTGVVDLNTFYGYPAAITRTSTPPTFGPGLTDPSCLYDVPTKRWFHVILALATDPRTGAYTGANSLDIAVSQTPDPTGAWNIYRLPVQNDGSQGTPTHPDCPCIGDYPHIGADANGFYISTNEYTLANNSFEGFRGVNIYALDKRALAAGEPSPRTQQFNLPGGSSGVPPFTVWPAVSPGTDNFEGDAGGTEYFLSSDIGDFSAITFNRLTVWGLSNTRSLRGGTPDLTLNQLRVAVNPYTVPSEVTQIAQKPGDFPLGQCLNDTTLPTATGPGCWRNFFSASQEPAHTETLAKLYSNDGRIASVVYANGELWGALDTAVQDSLGARVGIAWYVLRPGASKKSLVARVTNQGYITAPGGNSVTRPAIAINDDRRGVIGFTLAGPDHYPSAAFAAVDARRGSSQVYVAAAGKGPQDGGTGYQAFTGNTVSRWGDYGAAFSDGSTVWVANEYIAQSCTLAQYVGSAPLGRCGNTRVSGANWATRISAIDVGN